MKRRATATDPAPAPASTSPERAAPATPSTRGRPDAVGHSALAQRINGPQTPEQAEQRYVAARDAWTAAMRAASSGRPADLASLAIAQEAYEAAAAERERWLSGGRIAIPVESEDTRHSLDVAVGQELEWRRVRHHEPEGGLLSRVRRRLFGR
jgi:hypothetical protein